MELTVLDRHDAAARIGNAHPTPAFFIAQAMPTFLFCSQMSFTASSVSTRPVDGGAICPFGNVCPGRMALR